MAIKEEISTWLQNTEAFFDLGFDEEDEEGNL